MLFNNSTGEITATIHQRWGGIYATSVPCFVVAIHSAPEDLLIWTLHLLTGKMRD